MPKAISPAKGYFPCQRKFHQPKAITPDKEKLPVDVVLVFGSPGSKTLSLSEGLNVKSSTKNSGGKELVGGLFGLLLASSIYPESN